MLFSTSQDLLYMVLAICILWFTIFLCWLLYQAARVLKNANTIIESVTHKLELINEAVQYMRDKVDGVSKNRGIVSSLMGGFVKKFVVGKLASSLEAKVASRGMSGSKKKVTLRKKVSAKK